MFYRVQPLAFTLAVLVLAALGVLGGADAAPAQSFDVTEDWRFDAVGSHLGAAGFEVADLDGDGSPELVMGALDLDLSPVTVYPPYEPTNRYWSVVEVTSAPAFEVVWSSTPTLDTLHRLRVLDLDGDGADEVVVGIGAAVEIWSRQGGAMVRDSVLATAAQAVRGVDRADVDGDGSLEWVVCDADDVWVYDAATGALEAQHVGVGGTDLTIGDVDGDGALEIVVGGDPYEGMSGVGGNVLDGATGTLEWSSPRRFGRRVVAIDVDGVDGRDEILVWGTYDYGVAVIDGQSLDERWQSGFGFPEARDVAVGDVDQDGALEVVWSDEADELVRVLDLATGFEDVSISIGPSGILGLAVGDFTGNAVPGPLALDVVWSDASLFATEDRLRLFDSAFDSVVAETADRRGPSFGLATSVDAGGQPRLVHTLFLSDGPYGSGRYQVRATDGSLLSTGANDPWGGVRVWDVAAADLDGAPGDEIVVTQTLNGVYGVGARDATDQELWWISVNSGEAQSLAIADVDGDGALEVVAAMGRGWSGGELFRLDGATGALEQSLAGFGQTEADLTLLAVGELDGDAALEVVVAEDGGELTVVDGGTFQLQSASFGLAVTALEVVDVDGDGMDEILVGTASGDLQEIDLATGTVAATLGSYGTSGTAIHGLDARDVDADGDVDLAFVAGGVPTLVEASTGAVLWSGSALGIDLGAEAGRHGSLVLDDLDGDGAVELWINRGVLGMVIYEVTPIVGSRPVMTVYSPDPSAVNYCYLQPWGCFLGLSGDAVDAEDGWLPDSQVTWASDLEGFLGSGLSVYPELTVVGTHEISLSGVDSDGNVGVATVDFQVIDENLQAPSIVITAPADGSSVLLGETVTLVVVATDPEAGDISANVDWTVQPSWIWLGRGATLQVDSTQLGVGIHTIQAEVYDDPYSAQASIQLEVRADGPTVTITAPADGATVLEGDTIVFQGSAVDNQDGDLSASLTWTSSLEGTIGTGASFTAALMPGTHTIRAEAFDGDGWDGEAEITLTVEPNAPPAVSIASPADLSVHVDGDPITFTATAVDPEDGDLSSQIVWWSSSAGTLGSGASVTTTLPIGTLQLVRATVQDAQGFEGSAEVRFDVVPNQVPVVSITAPSDGTVLEEAESVTLSATASDAEDGDLTASIEWSSDLDGVYGTGGSLTVTPSVGQHSIRARVVDSKGEEGFHQVSLRVLPNQPPALSITAPFDGSSATVGDSVTFTGEAVDSEDGDLSAVLQWSSDLDGSLGVGASLATSSLSIGQHVVTAQVSDSLGAVGSAQVTLRVRPLPVTITVVSNGSEDGWIRESSETSGVGGTVSSSNSSAAGLRVGDAKSDRAMRSIVSFDTAAVPDGAEVQSAILEITRGGTRGGDPWTQPPFGALTIDVAPAGGFGTGPSLESADFESPAAVADAGTMSVAPSSGDVSTGALDAAGRAAVDRAGITQLRLAFAVEDDDDNADDQATFYAGEHGKNWRRPTLTIIYQE